MIQSAIAGGEHDERVIRYVGSVERVQHSTDERVRFDHKVAVRSRAAESSIAALLQEAGNRELSFLDEWRIESVEHPVL